MLELALQELGAHVQITDAFDRNVEFRQFLTNCIRMAEIERKIMAYFLHDVRPKINQLVI